MDKYYYLTILVLCYSGPVLVVFLHKLILKNKNIRYIYPSVFLSAIPFIIWDILATWRGHWSFNPKYVLGVNIINLPIEEYLFFLFIPQGCVLLWAAMHKHENGEFISWDSIKKLIIEKRR